MLRSSSVSALRRTYHFWLVAAPLWLLGWQPVVVVATPWINHNHGIRDTCRDHSFTRPSRDRLAFVSTATTMSGTTRPDKWESTWPVSSQVLVQPSSSAWNNNKKKCTKQLQSMRLHGTPSKDSEDDDRESIGTGSLQGFNPWDPTSSASASANLYQRAVQSSQQGTPRISIRQTQMQQVLSELLQAQSSSSATLESSSLESILESHASFLLAPFTSTTDFLDDDPNSIYTQCTNQTERYKCFQTTMKQRIQEARNPAVRTVLQALLEFVVDRVDDSPQDDS